MGAKPLPYINRDMRIVDPNGKPSFEFFDWLSGVFQRCGGLTAGSVGAQITDGTVVPTADATLPSGIVVLWPSNVAAPTGWILAQGQNISRATYSAIFAVYGTRFGVGDGHTTFGLPNLSPGAVPWNASMGWLPILSVFQGIIKT